MAPGLSLNMGLGFGGGSSWFSRSSLRAIDIADSQSKGPAAILDFRKGQQALTTVASGSIAGATTAQLIAINADTYANALTFTRASTATFIDVNGVMQTAAIDAPRFDYTNGARQLLVEGASTNLLLDSNNFSVASWGKTGSSVTATNIAGPDGNNTASAITSSTANALLTQLVTPLSGQVYTGSIWLKVPSGTLNTVLYLNGGGILIQKLITITTQWQRFFVTGTTTSTVGMYFQIGGDNTITNGQVFHSFGGQLEALPFASSYIPTTGSAVTRAGDIARLGPKLEALIQRAGGGTIVWRGRLQGLVTSTSSRLLGDGANSAFPGVTYGTPTTGNAEAWNGAAAINTGSNSLISSFGVSLSWATNSRNLSANGSGVVAGTGVLSSGLTKIWIGSGGPSGGVTPMYGWVDQLIIYPFRATDAEVQRLAAAYV